MENQGEGCSEDKHKSLKANKKALNEIVVSKEKCKTGLITQMKVNQMSQ